MEHPPVYFQWEGSCSNLSTLQQKEVILCSFQSTVRSLSLLCKTILYPALHILETTRFLSITYGRIMLAIINKSTGHQEIAFLYKPSGTCKNAGNDQPGFCFSYQEKTLHTKPQKRYQEWIKTHAIHRKTVRSSILVSADTELTFFLAAGTVLGFGFSWE